MKNLVKNLVKNPVKNLVKNPVKNPVKFMNKRGKPIFIYHIYDNSHLQICILNENESSLHNIPCNSHIEIKDAILMNDFIIPSGAFLKMKLIMNMNHIDIN